MKREGQLTRVAGVAGGYHLAHLFGDPRARLLLDLFGDQRGVEVRSAHRDPAGKDEGDHHVGVLALARPGAQVIRVLASTALLVRAQGAAHVLLGVGACAVAIGISRFYAAGVRRHERIETQSYEYCKSSCVPSKPAVWSGSMKTADALAHFAKTTTKAKPSYAIAMTLGVSRQAVEQWGKIVPEGSAYKLQALTMGVLKVDSACYRKSRRAA